MSADPTRPSGFGRAPAAAEHAVDAVPREARDFQGHRAGIVSRSIANSTDFAIVQVSVFALYLGWAGLRFIAHPKTFSMPPMSFGRWLVMTFGVLFLYFFVSWVTTGRTYGDHLMGLRVVGVRGTRMRPAWAALRALFCCVLPIGLFWTAVSRENRSVQDAVMRTSVIYDWYVQQPPPDPNPPPPTPQS